MGPCAAGALLLPPTNHWDFTHKRNRAERVQTVNAGDGGGVWQAGLGIQVVASCNGSALRTSSSRLMRLSATEKARSDAHPHQSLEHWFQMAGWQRMAGRQRLGGHRPPFAMEGHVDDGSNREEPLAGEQRHGNPGIHYTT